MVTLPTNIIAKDVAINLAHVINSMKKGDSKYERSSSILF